MISHTNQSVLLPQDNNNIIRALLGIQFNQRPLPKLKSGEVLVEMAYAPCNPSDIAFLRGGYNVKKTFPAVPGFEASGRVVETAKDVSHLLGKPVSCFTQALHDGTWASHFIARARDCIVLKEGMDMKQAACLGINPLTALGMYEEVINKDCPAFILNAAGGQVPKFMASLADRDQIPVIQIVRKADQAEQMKNAGQEFILDSSSGHFGEELKELCIQLKPTLAFDAVGGELSGQIIEAMPDDSSLIVYGALGGTQIVGIDAMDVIFHGKSVRGFNLNHWISSMDQSAFTKKTDQVQDLIINGQWQTQIQEVFHLEEVVKGIRKYIQSMSGGKVLFKP